MKLLSLLQIYCTVIANQLVDLVELTAACIEIARYGGSALVEAINNDDLDDFVIQNQNHTDPGHAEVVTNADLESNRRMSFAFPVLFPGVHVRSEEVTEPPNTIIELPRTKAQWEENKNYNFIKSKLSNQSFTVPTDNITIWIDPLDATREYTEGLYEYVTNMIGVAVNGVPVIGVLNAPFQKRLQVGFSFDSNNLIYSIGDKMTNSSNNLYVSRSYWKRLSQNGKVELVESVSPMTVKPAGGAGYKSWRVISEQNSVYLHTRRIKLWDLCAPEAVLRASGGFLTTLNGNSIDYRYTQNALHSQGVVAATNSTLHEMIVRDTAALRVIQ